MQDLKNKLDFDESKRVSKFILKYVLLLYYFSVLARTLQLLTSLISSVKLAKTILFWLRITIVFPCVNLLSF